jgi:hypothetical protein
VRLYALGGETTVLSKMEYVFGRCSWTVQHAGWSAALPARTCRVACVGAASAEDSATSAEAAPTASAIPFPLLIFPPI